MRSEPLEELASPGLLMIQGLDQGRFVRDASQRHISTFLSPQDVGGSTATTAGIGWQAGKDESGD